MNYKTLRGLWDDGSGMNQYQLMRHKKIGKEESCSK